MSAKGCGVARRLAGTGRQAGPSSILSRHPMWKLFLLSGKAMKIREDGPRQMMRDERMCDCIG